MYPRCNQFGFDREKITRRLEFLRLTKSDHKLAKRLKTEVIAPNVNIIIDRFYENLLFHSQSRKWLMDGGTIDKLKRTQSKYLLSLGINFDSEQYFEERLGIGIVHAKIGLPLSIYQGAYSNLIQYIIDAFPESIRMNIQDCLALIDYLIRITSLDITLATETYHNAFLSELNDEILLAQTREKDLRNLAETDALTGLYNRTHVYTLLNAVIVEQDPYSSGLCILMLDLDYFKKINDGYGHQAGDEVLRQAATVIHESLREQDIAGRYGGEEFIIGLLDISQETAAKVAERLRMAIADTPIILHEKHIFITASIGAAFLKKDEDLKSVVKRADTALYLAKGAGRNRVSFS